MGTARSREGSYEEGSSFSPALPKGLCDGAVTPLASLSRTGALIPSSKSPQSIADFSSSTCHANALRIQLAYKRYCAFRLLKKAFTTKAYHVDLLARGDAAKYVQRAFRNFLWLQRVKLVKQFHPDVFWEAAHHEQKPLSLRRSIPLPSDSLNMDDHFIPSKDQGRSWLLESEGEEEENENLHNSVNAMKIQRTFKRFASIRLVSSLIMNSRESKQQQMEQERQTEAACTIQATFRGYRYRVLRKAFQAAKLVQCSREIHNSIILANSVPVRDKDYYRPLQLLMNVCMKVDPDNETWTVIRQEKRVREILVHDEEVERLQLRRLRTFVDISWKTSMDVVEAEICFRAAILGEERRKWVKLERNVLNHIYNDVEYFEEHVCETAQDLAHATVIRQWLRRLACNRISTIREARYDQCWKLYRHDNISKLEKFLNGCWSNGNLVYNRASQRKVLRNVQAPMLAHNSVLSGQRPFSAPPTTVDSVVPSSFQKPLTSTTTDYPHTTNSLVLSEKLKIKSKTTRTRRNLYEGENRERPSTAAAALGSGTTNTTTSKDKATTSVYTVAAEELANTMNESPSLLTMNMNTSMTTTTSLGEVSEAISYLERTGDQKGGRRLSTQSNITDPPFPRWESDTTFSPRVASTISSSPPEDNPASSYMDHFTKFSRGNDPIIGVQLTILNGDPLKRPTSAASAPKACPKLNTVIPDSAACCVQRAIRSWLAVQVAAKQRTLRENTIAEADNEVAVVDIQRFLRGYLTRHKLRKSREQQQQQQQHSQQEQQQHQHDDEEMAGKPPITSNNTSRVCSSSPPPSCSTTVNDNSNTNMMSPESHNSSSGSGATQQTRNRRKPQVHPKTPSPLSPTPNSNNSSPQPAPRSTSLPHSNSSPADLFTLNSSTATPTSQQPLTKHSSFPGFSSPREQRSKEVAATCNTNPNLRSNRTFRNAVNLEEELQKRSRRESDKDAWRSMTYHAIHSTPTAVSAMKPILPKLEHLRNLANPTTSANSIGVATTASLKPITPKQQPQSAGLWGDSSGTPTISGSSTTSVVGGTTSNSSNPTSGSHIVNYNSDSNNINSNSNIPNTTSANAIPSPKSGTCGGAGQGGRQHRQPSSVSTKKRPGSASKRQQSQPSTPLTPVSGTYQPRSRKNSPTNNSSTPADNSLPPTSDDLKDQSVDNGLVSRLEHIERRLYDQQETQARKKVMDNWSDGVYAELIEEQQKQERRIRKDEEKHFSHTCKVFHKQWEQLPSVIAVITIQRVWRGCKARQYVNTLRLEQLSKRYKQLMRKRPYSANDFASSSSNSHSTPSVYQQQHPHTSSPLLRSVATSNSKKLTPPTSYCDHNASSNNNNLPNSRLLLAEEPSRHTYPLRPMSAPSMKPQRTSITPPNSNQGHTSGWMMMPESSNTTRDTSTTLPRSTLPPLI